MIIGACQIFLLIRFRVSMPPPSAVAADPYSCRLTKKVNGPEQCAAAAGSDITLEAALCIPFTRKKKYVPVLNIIRK